MRLVRLTTTTQVMLCMLLVNGSKRSLVCVPLAIGLWGSLLSPMPVKKILVFGKPLMFQAKQKGAPTSEEVDSAHIKFCAELKKLFDEHKQEAGYGERDLEIV